MMLFKLPFKDYDMSWSQRCGLRLKSSYQSAVLPNASAAQLQRQKMSRWTCRTCRTCRTCCTCWIGVYSEAHRALFQRPWDKLRPAVTGWTDQGNPNLSFFCVWLDILLICFWYAWWLKWHSVEVPLGPTNRKKLERTLQDGSVGVGLSWRRVEHCYWHHQRKFRRETPS